MASKIILLSGPVNSGKTTLAGSLQQRYSFAHFKTHDAIKAQRPKVDEERGAMQSAGEWLDKSTNGRWVADAVAREAIDLDDNAVIIVDAVRIKEQVDGLREAFGKRVVHVHLTAPDAVLADRYSTRKSRIKEFKTYAEVKRNKTESQVDDLKQYADIVIDSRRSTPGAVVVRVAAHLGLYGRGYERLVDVLVGGQFGSEGKGNIASYLAEEYQVLMRVG